MRAFACGGLLAHALALTSRPARAARARSGTFREYQRKQVNALRKARGAARRAFRSRRGPNEHAATHRSPWSAS
jgi:hypothetical protein